MSIVGDFSLHLGSSGGNDVTRATFLGGARWAWALPAAGPDEKHLLLAHVLAGAVRDHVGAQSRTDPAVAFGGAYEYDPNGHASALAFRMQVDYVHAFRGGEGFPRATFAFVHRIN